MTEKQHDENWVKKRIKVWLLQRGAYSFPIPANGMGVSGIPDRIAVFEGGLFVAIEAKRPGRRGQADRGCSALQVKSLRAIAAKGGFSWVVDGDEDLDALEVELRKFWAGGMAVFTNLDMGYWKVGK